LIKESETELFETIEAQLRNQTLFIGRLTLEFTGIIFETTFPIT
jgi:hypothetical protein